MHAKKLFQFEVKPGQREFARVWPRFDKYVDIALVRILTPCDRAKDLWWRKVGFAEHGQDRGAMGLKAL